MKQKDILAITVIVIIAAVFSSIISGALFNSSKKHNLKAPIVQPIDSNFPQVSTDDTYKSFFNSQALDPTQLIQIGTSQNNTPISGQ